MCGRHQIVGPVPFLVRSIASCIYDDSVRGDTVEEEEEESTSSR